MQSTALDPIMMSLLRFGIATLAMTPLLFRSSVGAAGLTFRDIAVLSGLGLLGVTGFALFVFYGIDLSNATSSSILINSQPLFAALLSALILKERITTRQIFGILLGIAGLYLVVSRGDFTIFATGSTYLAGNLICLAASLSISLYYIFIRDYVSRYGSTIATFISTAAGANGLLIIAIAAGTDFSKLASLSPVDWLMLLHIALIITAGANLLFHQSLVHLGVARAASFKFLVPIFGVFFSYYLLGERMNTAVYSGILIVLAAILLIQWRGLKKGR